MRWPVAFLVLLTSCATTTKLPPQLKLSPASTQGLTANALMPPAPLFFAPVHRYPLNTNQIGLRTNIIPILWHTNQLKGKSAFDVQESHDLKTWITIQTNVWGDPQVTNTVNPTFWRVVAR